MVELLKKQNKNILKNNDGISLIEAIIAVAVGIILIVSLLTLTNFNIRSSLLASENQNAINNANFLLETLRSQKDTNFTSFLTNTLAKCGGNNYCSLANDGSYNTVSADTDSTIPVSYFNVVKNSDNEVLINIMTYWKIGSSKFSSPLSTLFTNWRAK